MKKLLVITLASLSILMVGCEDHLQETKKQIKEIDLNAKARIDPIPEFGDMSLVDYVAQGYRNPFYPYSLYSELQNAPAYKSVYVNPNRKRQALENYEIDSLTMVGIVSKGGRLSAVMQTPEKDLVIVGVGTYMGLNQGRVTKINKHGLDLVEIMADGRGDYRERGRSIISLQNDSNSTQPLNKQ